MKHGCTVEFCGWGTYYCKYAFFVKLALCGILAARQSHDQACSEITVSFVPSRLPVKNIHRKARRHEGIQWRLWHIFSTHGDPNQHDYQIHEKKDTMKSLSSLIQTCRRRRPP